MIQIPRDGEIALVDDDDLDRMIMSRVLGISNLENTVIDYPSAESFIDDLATRNESGHIGLSLVLMDVNMPGMSGLEALEHIRSVLGLIDLPIIVMLTSSEAGADMEKATQLGAHGYLAKQSGIDKFVGVIDEEFVNV